MSGERSGEVSHDEVRHDLGVYVLGSLEPAERDRVERHLATCDSCREELARLAVLPSLLARVPATEAGWPPPAPPVEPVLARVTRERRRERHRSRALTAVAVLATLAALAVVVLPLLPRAPDPALATFATADGSMTARVEQRAWGMAVRLSTGALPPSPGYVAVAVAPDGHRAQVVSWTDVGRPVELEGSCYLPAEEVQRLEILAAPGNEVVAVLAPG